jgi:hypothetical protein
MLNIYRFNFRSKYIQAALVTGFILVLLVWGRPAIAELLGTAPTHIPDFSKVALGTETVNGYQQVIYKKDGSRAFLTSGHYNHTKPSGKGQYVVWQTTVNGGEQIELYDVARNVRFPVTMEGTNQNAQVDESGRVVWERWVDDRWQVMYHYGSSSRQISEGDVSVRPVFLGDSIIYAAQDATGNWSAKQYNIQSQKTEVIKEGPEAQWLQVADGTVKFSHGN